MSFALGKHRLTFVGGWRSWILTFNGKGLIGRRWTVQRFHGIGTRLV